MGGRGEKWGEVENPVFQGTTLLSLDAKGRLAMPARHRDQLAEVSQGQVTLTRGIDNCLWMLPRATWIRFRDQLLAMPTARDDVKRHFVGHAVDVDMDSASRILVPPELRAVAGLEKDVKLMGVGKMFEIWHAPAQTEADTKVSADTLRAGIGNIVL